MSIVLTVLSFFILVLGPIGPISVVKAASPLPKPRPLGSKLRSLQPGDLDLSPEKLLMIELPSATLNLRQALTLALIKNPELAAISWEVRVRDASRLQAGLFPNPQISLEIEEIGGSAFRGTNQAETTLFVGQRIQLAGTREKRKKAARLIRDLAGWDYETKRLALFTEVSLRFIAVLGNQEKVSLNEDLVRLARQVSETVSQRVNAGKVSPVEGIKANIGFSSAGIDLGRAKRQLTASRNKLASMWGSPKPEFQSVEGKLDLALSLPSFEALAARLPQNPKMDRWQTELQQRKAVIALEKAKAIPDITIGGGFRQFKATDTNTFVAGISIDLPIFNRNQGGILKAEARYAKALAEQQSTALRLKTALAEAYRTLSSTHATAEALKNDLLPGANKAFEAVTEGYHLGKFDLLDVLDAQRTLAGARAQYLQTQIDFQASLARVEQLTGAPLNQEKLISK